MAVSVWAASYVRLCFGCFIDCEPSRGAAHTPMHAIRHTIRHGTQRSWQTTRAVRPFPLPTLYRIGFKFNTDVTDYWKLMCKN